MTPAAQAAHDALVNQLVTLAAALLGAVVGAVMGGLITYVTGRNERIRAEKAAGVRLTLKLSKITSSLAGTYRQIVASIREAEASGVNGALWNKMLAMTGGSPIVILPEELDVITDKDSLTFLNRLMLIDDKHNNVMAAISHYSARRTDLMDRLPASMEGRKGTVTLDRATFEAIGPKIAELEMMAENILRDLREYAELSMGLATDLGPLLRAKFNDKSIPIMRPNIELPALPFEDRAPEKPAVSQ